MPRGDGVTSLGMDQPNDLTPTLAAVGQLLLTWGWVETEMAVVMDRAGAPPHPSPMTRWRKAADQLPTSVVILTAELERLAQVRNLIAHGLSAARSQPQPVVEARTPADDRVVISLADLIETAQALDRIRREIIRAR